MMLTKERKRSRRKVELSADKITLQMEDVKRIVASKSECWICEMLYKHIHFISGQHYDAYFYTTDMIWDESIVEHVNQIKGIKEKDE